MLVPQRNWKPHAWTVLVVMTVAFPLVLLAALSALRSTSNDPRQWLPKRFAETDRYDWFQEQFGSDEIGVLSWDGCTLDSPTVPTLAKSLEQSVYIDRVQTGASVLQQLTDPSVGLTRADAMRRLRGSLIGEDGKTTCLVMSTSDAGKDDRVATVEEIKRLATEVCQVAPAELKLAGPTVDAAAIDIESRRLLFELAGIAALLSFLVASLRLRSISLAIMVFAVAGYSTLVALSLLYLTGTRMNLLMTMLPPLIYVLSISSAVHFANYYRDAVRDASPIGALKTALQNGWLPCVLAAGTTAIGLASLVMSKIDPIREFGIFSALGVLLSVGVLLLMLPAALYLFPPRLRFPSAPLSGERRPSLSQLVVNKISRHHAATVIVCLAMMAFFGCALPRLKSTVKLQDRFLQGSDAIMDYHWLEDEIGPMVPLEVVLHFDKEDPRDLVQRMRVVAKVQSKIQSLDEPVSTMSAINFSPQVPTGTGIRQLIARKMLDRPSTGARWTEAKYLAASEDEQLWRITVRAKAIGDLDYGRFSEKIRATVDPVLEQHDASGTYTGVIPLIYKAQRQLLNDLFRSFLAAFGVIAVVLVFVLRSLPAAILAMIPNLFPAVVVFGGIQWLDIPVQIGSVMTASAALGIAVDDTVHFLTWFRRGLTQGLDGVKALSDAFARCSGAMVQTTMICSSGLLVFALSSFVPILHFAWLMVFLLLSALIGDLVLLPAILAGPMGRWFEQRSSPS